MQTVSAPTENEIESVFDKLGLTAHADRVPYLGAYQPAPAVNYEIVFSTTSNPFAA